MDINEGNTYVMTIGALENYITFVWENSTFIFNQSIIDPGLSGT